MSKNIGILNCYADEPKSALSATYFANVFDGTKIINICFNEKIANINSYDGYIISGSRSGHKDKGNWISELRNIIKNIHKYDIPCLAVCFGHQAVAHTFSGSTVRNLAGEEGFQNIPTMAGNETIHLFDGLPNPVKVYQSHKDAVMKPPKGSHNVIYNEKCVQYFQYGSIHSIQSHPEITVPIAIEFAKKENRNIEDILNGVTSENFQSDKILKNFYNIVNNSKTSTDYTV